MCCRSDDSESRRIGVGLFKLVLIAVAILIALLAGILLPFAFAAEPTPAPNADTQIYSFEWWIWFSAQKTVVEKSDQTIAGKAEVRPLVSEITLSDPKALPKGIWGVRRYRKYIEDERKGAGLWCQGEFYEVLWAAGSASVVTPSVKSWEATVSKDPKYNPVASVVAP